MKLSFQGIYLKNFVKHKESELFMENGQSIFLSGVNYDALQMKSNGSGKSLVLDALLWCLYDKTVRGFGKNEVIGPFGTWASVETKWLDEEGRKINVIRWRNNPQKRNLVEVFINGEDASKVTNTKEMGTQALIQNLFGADQRAFLYTTIFSRDRDSLCEEKDTGRRELLSHILGLEAYDKAKVKAAVDKRKYDKQYTELVSKIRELEVSLSGIKSRISDAKESFELAKRDLAKRNKHVAKKNKKAESERKKIKNSILKLEDKVLKLSTTLTDYSQIKEDIEVLERKKEEYKKKKESWKEKEYWSKMKVEEKKEEINELRKKSGGECAVCGQLIRPDHVRRVVEVSSRNLKAFENEVKSHAKRRIKWRDKIVHIIDKIDELETSIDDSSKEKMLGLKMRINSLKRELKRVKIEKKEDKDFSVYEIKISELEKNSVKVFSKLNELKGQYKKTSKELDMASFWVKAFGQKGVKGLVINKALDSLEVMTNERLKKMTDGYMSVVWESAAITKTSGNIVDKLTINVNIGNDEPCDYKFCSRGEKTRVWLATEMAQRDLIETVCDVSFIDEVLDGLDEPGLRTAMEIISGEGKVNKVLCTSHRPEVKKFFNSHFVVERKDGISCIAREEG